MMPSRNRRASGMAARLAMGVIGGYLLAYCGTALAALALPVRRVDAVLLPTMISFILYAAVVIYAVAGPRGWQVCLAASFAVACTYAVLAMPG